jgi:serine/threonine-protein kinase RsbW
MELQFDRDDGDLAIAEIPTRPEAISAARRLVERAAREAGLREDRIDNLLIARSEACTNALEAQLEAGIHAPVALRCGTFPDELRVEVQDCAGGGFDEARIAPRPPRTDPGHLDVERGWGIQLMRQLVDRVEFDHRPDGTVVRLVMRR